LNHGWTQIEEGTIKRGGVESADYLTAENAKNAEMELRAGRLRQTPEAGAFVNQQTQVAEDLELLADFGADVFVVEMQVRQVRF
jgi:hypothetical protein